MAIVLSGSTGIDAGSLPVNNCGNTEVEGNLNLSGVGTRITGDFSNAILGNRVAFQSSTTNGITIIGSIPNGTSTTSGFLAYGSSDINNSPTSIVYNDGVATNIVSSKQGTGIYTPMSFYTGGSERMRIDAAGNVLVTSSGGLGYGTGAGGTVTQLTSKSTAVTLNKPSGTINMNNAALAAGASVGFILNNNLILGNQDLLSITTGGASNYDISYSCGTGIAFILIKNKTAGSLSESVVINFAVIKGATA